MFTIEEVIGGLLIEIARAREKHPGQDKKTIGEWILLMEDELAEAKKALIKGGVSENSVMAEICQVTGLGIQAMLQHGTTGPDERSI